MTAVITADLLTASLIHSPLNFTNRRYNPRQIIKSQALVRTVIILPYPFSVFSIHDVIFHLFKVHFDILSNIYLQSYQILSII